MYIVAYKFEVILKEKVKTKRRRERPVINLYDFLLTDCGSADLFRMIENYSMSTKSKRSRKTNLFVQDQCLTGHIYYTEETLYNYRLV